MAVKTFWTARRLRELRSKARKMELPQLSRYFEKSEDSCRQALIYANNMNKMRIKKVKETINGTLQDVVKLEPGYALYAHRTSATVGRIDSGIIESQYE